MTSRLLHSPPSSNLRFYLVIYFLFLPFLIINAAGCACPPLQPPAPRQPPPNTRSSRRPRADYTILVTSVSAFLFLTIEAAASDVDVGPFQATRLNHIDCDAMLLRIEADVEHLLEALYERND